MRPDITINGISMASLGWLRESISFPTPKSQTNTIVVPGRNTPIRYTEALGRVSYQPRTFQMVFTMYGTREKFNQMAKEAANQFSGVLSTVITSEEPHLYAIGTLEVTTSYDPLANKGVAEFSSEDGDSYRYHVEETTISFEGEVVASLENDYMPVIPTVKTTEETTFKWSVGEEKFIKTVNAGTWTFPELELVHGENTIEVSGDGIVTFIYREGCL